MGAATAEVVSTVILQLLQQAQVLASKQATGVPVTEDDVTAALTLESVTHDQLVAAIAAVKAAAPAKATP